MQMEPLSCPIDGTLMIDTSLWTDGLLKDYLPRLIYDINRNTLLVSKRYKCEACKRRFLAHDRALQWQLRKAKLQMLLLKKSGVTADLYSFIVNVSTQTGILRYNMLFTFRNIIFIFRINFPIHARRFIEYEKDVLFAN